MVVDAGRCLHPAGFMLTSETAWVAVNVEPEERGIPAGLIDQKAAAAFLGMSVRTLPGLRKAGRLAFVMNWSHIRYALTDLQAYIETNRVTTGSK